MEEWRFVPGYEGYYEVSSTGRVRRVRAGRGTRARELRVNYASRYPSVVLTKNGTQKRYEVHRLVAEAFIPNPDGKPWVLHWDDDPTNNRVGNLRWGYPKENSRDAERNNPRGKTLSCPRGHRYVDENIVRYAWRTRGVRVCKACARATDYARRRGLEFDPEIADMKYADVLKNVTRGRWGVLNLKDG